MIKQTNYLKYLLTVGGLILLYLIYWKIASGYEKDLSDAGKLEAIPIVEIDHQGRFKYILAQVFGKNSAGRMVLSKFVIRGHKKFVNHADICDHLRDKVAEQGLKAKCIGGGRIEHYPDSKKIKVYGFSKTYGKPDHQHTRTLLLTKYKGYIIETTDAGY